MDKKHIKQIHDMLRNYGTAPVIQAIAEDLEEEAKLYSEGAIIHQNLPIIQAAAVRLNAFKMARFSHVRG